MAHARAVPAVAVSSTLVGARRRIQPVAQFFRLDFRAVGAGVERQALAAAEQAHAPEAAVVGALHH